MDEALYTGENRSKIAISLQRSQFDPKFQVEGSTWLTFWPTLYVVRFGMSPPKVFISRVRYPLEHITGWPKNGTVFLVRLTFHKVV